MPVPGERWKNEKHPGYVLMRRWRNRADAAHQKHLALRPRHGTIGIGSEDMRPWFEYMAITEFLSSFSKSQSAEQARREAGQEVRNAVTRWNNVGCKARVSINGRPELHYWAEHGQDLIEDMERAFHGVVLP